MIHQGDALEVLRTMRDESVQCCVTSPPYWGLRDYGVDGQLGLERTPEEYVAKLVAVFREVRRVLRNDGTLWLNLGDCYTDSGRGKDIGSTLEGSRNNQRESRKAVMRQTFKGLPPKQLVGVPWRVALALQSDGWWLRADIIWAKPNPMPESVRDRTTRAHEYVFLLSKSRRYFYNAAAIAEPVVADPAARRNDWNTRDVLVPGQKPQKRSDRTRSKWAALHPQASGRRMNESTTRARAAGGLHDSPFGATRNRRSVWTITPENFRGAHFATMPTRLVRLCILAGSSGGGSRA